MTDYGTEHEGAGWGDPDVGAAATTGELDGGGCGEAGGKGLKESSVSGGIYLLDGKELGFEGYQKKEGR